MSRYMLRGAQAQGNSLSLHSSGKGSRATGVLGGKKGRGSSAHSRSALKKGDNNSSAEQRMVSEEAERVAEREMAVFGEHKRVLQGLLNRLEDLIPIQDLLDAVLFLLHNYIPPINDFPVTNVDNHSPAIVQISPLFTDAGLAVVSCFTVKILTGKLPLLLSPDSNRSSDGNKDSDRASAIQRDAEELFFTLQEAKKADDYMVGSCSSTNIAPSLNDNVTSNSPPVLEGGLSLDVDLNAFNALHSLLSLISVLGAHEELMRKASVASIAFLSPTPSQSPTPSSSVHNRTSARIGGSKNGNPILMTTSSSSGTHVSELNSCPSMTAATPVECDGMEEVSTNNYHSSLDELSGLMGSPLDRPGCAVLLLSLYRLLDQVMIT
jgi:hypothetical protein